MLAKCANPACSTPFHYLREGKIFRFDSAANGPALVQNKKPARVEHFWLCGPCSVRWKLAYDRKGVAVTVPLQPLAQRAAAS